MSTRGLEGVVAAETSLSKVFGDEGRLVYGGYEIEDLAENTTFEEVCYLLWHGQLPVREQLEDLHRRLTAAAPACARMAGWTAHVIEQHKNNRLIRPKSDYLGPMGLEVIPLEQRV